MPDSLDRLARSIKMGQRREVEVEGIRYRVTMKGVAPSGVELRAAGSLDPNVVWRVDRWESGRWTFVGINTGRLPNLTEGPRLDPSPDVPKEIAEKTVEIFKGTNTPVLSREGSTWYEYKATPTGEVVYNIYDPATDSNVVESDIPLTSTSKAELPTPPPSGVTGGFPTPGDIEFEDVGGRRFFVQDGQVVASVPAPTDAPDAGLARQTAGDIAAMERLEADIASAEREGDLDRANVLRRQLNEFRFLGGQQQQSRQFDFLSGLLQQLPGMSGAQRAAMADWLERTGFNIRSLMEGFPQPVPPILQAVSRGAAPTGQGQGPLFRQAGAVGRPDIRQVSQLEQALLARQASLGGGGFPTPIGEEVLSARASQNIGADIAGLTREEWLAQQFPGQQGMAAAIAALDARNQGKISFTQPDGSRVDFSSPASALPTGGGALRGGPGTGGKGLGAPGQTGRSAPPSNLLNDPIMQALVRRG